MIKAVIFDMGGVIVNLDLERCIRSFKEKAGCADIEQYLDAFHQKGFIGEMEKGLLSEEEFYHKCRQHCRPDTPNEIIAECFSDLITGLNEETVSIIRELSRRGYSLYVLSNNNPISARVFSSMKDPATGRPMPEYFQKFFFSFEMRMLKPMPGFFMKVIKEIGCRPEEALFIDDSEKNTAVAEKLGIRSILYKSGTLAGQIYRFTENLSFSH